MESPPDASMEDLIAVFNQINQYAQANGMTLEVEAPGRVAYRMTVREEHLSSPGTAHGGVLAGLMDATIGAAALSLAFTREQLVATVEFKINYFQPVHLGDALVATGQIEHAGKRIVSASGKIHRAGEGGGASGEPVAGGLGTFNAYPMAKRDFSRFGETL